MSLKFRQQADGSWIGYRAESIKKVKLNERPNNSLKLAKKENDEMTEKTSIFENMPEEKPKSKTAKNNI